jgi:hypothetical protein
MDVDSSMSAIGNDVFRPICNFFYVFHVHWQVSLPLPCRDAGASGGVFFRRKEMILHSTRFEQKCPIGLHRQGWEPEVDATGGRKVRHVPCSDEVCEQGRATGRVDVAVTLVFLTAGIRGERLANMIAAT